MLKLKYFSKNKNFIWKEKTEIQTERVKKTEKNIKTELRVEREEKCFKNRNENTTE